MVVYQQPANIYEKYKQSKTPGERNYPTFNRAAYYRAIVDSVLAQTFTDYEIIVVDDGSTDNTGEFLKKHYGDQDKVYCAINKQRFSAARNAGIEASRGTYIAILDDDDLWLPEKLALQVELLEKNPDVSLAYCGTLKVNSRGELIEEVKPEKEGPYLRRDAQSELSFGSLLRLRFFPARFFAQAECLIPAFPHVLTGTCGYGSLGAAGSILLTGRWCNT